MVGREDLINAIALNSSMFNGARMVGPGGGRLLVAAVGEGWCFFANGVSYLAVIAGLLMMRITVRGHACRARLGAGQHRRRVPLRPAHAAGPRSAAAAGLVSLMGMPYAVLMPIFADQILHGGPDGLGMLMAAAGVRRAGRGPDAGGQERHSRPGTLGRASPPPASASSLILFSLSRIVLAVGGAADAGRVLHDDPDGLVEHAHPVAGAGQAARPGDGGLLDDVHGHGAVRLAAGRRSGARLGAPGTVAFGGVACITGALVFGLRLPVLRHEARQNHRRPPDRRRRARGDDGPNEGSSAVAVQQQYRTDLIPITVECFILPGGIGKSPP